MRRALLLLTGLSLFGLTVAVASSFEANTEDLTTFSTEVSISVPERTLPPEIYLRSDGDGGFTLDLIPPEGNDPVTKQLVRLAATDLAAQASPGFYVAWKSPPAPSSGYLLQGNVALYLQQDGLLTHRMTAGLLSCPTSAPPASTGCTTLALAVADQPAAPSTDVPCQPGQATGGGGGGQGFKERRVCFGDLSVTVPAGEELRLKVVNRSQQPVGTTVSSADWSLQWGFNPARPSRLVTL